jgi:2,6-dihydroxypseudooxynicotine hydrolase
MADGRVEAMRRIVSRFVATGVDFGDATEILAKIETWDDWCRTWSAQGRVLEDLAIEAEKAGRTATAGDLYAQSAVTYHFGKFLFSIDKEQHREASQAAVRTYNRAMPLLDPPVERVEIPFEALTMAGALRKPANADKPPVLILVPGLDATKEEMHNFSSTVIRRGIAALSFDGPGQGETFYKGLFMRAEYEAASSAAIDWLETRSDVDARRVGIMGVSLGGYYAPRAASLEPRIKAVASVCGPFDWSACWEPLQPLSRQSLMFHGNQPDEEFAFQFTKRFSLEGLADRIKAPVLSIQGGRDPRIPEGEKERLVKSVSGPATYQFYPDGEHVCHNISYKYRPYLVDWMAEQLR